MFKIESKLENIIFSYQCYKYFYKISQSKVKLFLAINCLLKLFKLETKSVGKGQLCLKYCQNRLNRKSKELLLND